MTENQSTIEIPYLEIFNEENWPKCIAKKYLINSHTFYIDEEDTEFFINDCTNPNYEKLKIKNAIEEVIKEKLNGQSFLKVYGRTAKDINNTMSKILNIEDLTMAIKMSEFLTEALDDELEHQKQQISIESEKEIKLKFTLREYKNYLESPTQQFKLYALNDSLVAICQKVPNHISTEPNEQQIKKAKQLIKNIHEGIVKILEIEGNEHKNLQNIKIVVDCFISETGQKAKIFSIDPIHPLHCLSLFSELELKEIYEKHEKSEKKETINLLIKYVKTPEEFKEVDLSYYRVGWELGDKEALEEWKEFIKEN